MDKLARQSSTRAGDDNTSIYIQEMYPAVVVGCCYCMFEDDLALLDALNS